jgi:hypothetical protein
MSRNIFLYRDGKLHSFESHKTPEFKIEKRYDWVVYGNDKDDREWYNRYPDFLIHLYNSSAKNNAIINSKCDFITGQGLSYSNIGLDISNKISVQAFINRITDNEVFERTVKDHIIQGGFANEMVYNKALDKVEPYHVDFSKVRVSKPVWNHTDNKWEDPIFYYTNDWSVRKPEENEDFTTFELFKWTKDKTEIDKNKRYLVYYKEYRPNLGVYPLPDYIACIPYVAADYEIGNFTYNNVKNGFSSGYLINFYNGEPTDEQKRQIVNDFDNVLHGTDNAGRSIKSFNEDKESGVEIMPLNANGQDDRFINLNNSIRDEIYTGHGVDPVIVGLKGQNGFNNNADEKRTAIEAWQNGYVDQKQKVYEDYFTNILNFNGITGKIKILKKKPITVQLSEATIVQISTLDELREMQGLPKSNLENNKVAESLSTLSPLVATKVLDNMELNEIRNLIGLPNIDSKSSIPTTTTIEMSADDRLVKMFSETGFDDSELKLVNSRQTPIFGTDDAFDKEQILKSKFITQQEQSVLKMLIGGNEPEQIQSTLKITTADYTKLAESLTEKGLIDENGVTTKGTREADKNEVFVVYKYVKRNDVKGGVIIDTTRPFCQKMVEMSKTKSWTIEQIRALNNDMSKEGSGLAASDVFTSRGGWRTLPNTNIHVPYCRHIWETRLVRQK